VQGLRDCEDGGALLLRVGRGVVIMIVASWMIVVVLTDMEMEVEESCAELSVPMPVAGGVQADPADADNTGDRQSRPRPLGKADHGTAEALHVLILTDRAAQFL